MRQIAGSPSSGLGRALAILGLLSWKSRFVVPLCLLLGWDLMLTIAPPPETKSHGLVFIQAVRLLPTALLHFLVVLVVTMELVGLSLGPGGRLIPHRRADVLSVLLRGAGLLWLVDAGILWWTGDLGWWWAQMWGFFIVPWWLYAGTGRPIVKTLAPSLILILPLPLSLIQDPATLIYAHRRGSPVLGDLVLILGLIASVHLLVLINRPHRPLTRRSRMWLPMLSHSAPWQVPTWTGRSLKRVRGAVSLAMEMALLHSGQVGVGVLLGAAIGVLGLTPVLSASGMPSGLLIGSWVLLQGTWGMTQFRLRPVSWPSAVAGLLLARCVLALSPVVGLLLGMGIGFGVPPIDGWMGARPTWSITPITPLVAEGWFCLLGVVAVAVRSLLDRIGPIPWLGEMRMLTMVLVAILALGLGQLPMAVAVVAAGALLALAWWSWLDIEPAALGARRDPRAVVEA